MRRGGITPVCRKSHTPADPNPQAKPPTFAREDAPPWTGEKDRPGRWDNSPRRAYMQPVSYEHHCQGCHRLELPGGTVLPHERMEVVRAAIAGIPAEKLEWLAPRPKAPARGASPAGTPSPGGGRPPPSIRRPPRYMGPPPQEKDLMVWWRGGAVDPAPAEPAFYSVTQQLNHSTT